MKKIINISKDNMRFIVGLAAVLVLMFVTMSINQTNCVSQTSYADQTDGSDHTNYEVPKSSLDSVLYDQLCDNYKRVTGNRILTLYSNTFNSAEFTKLNLSNSASTGFKIKSLNNFNLFEFSYVTQVDLSGNSLGVISDDNFSSFDKLEQLDLSFNQLQSYNLTQLNTINLLKMNNNLLTNVDLSVINDSDQIATINLDNNCLSSMNDITIFESSDQKGVKISAHNNNITDYDASEYDDTINFSLGMQGLNSNARNLKNQLNNQAIIYAIEGVKVNCYNTKTKQTTTFNSIADQDVKIDLPVGEYEISLYNLDVLDQNFDQTKVTIIPSSLLSYFNIDGKKDYDTTNIDSVQTIHFESLDKNAVIEYSFNGKDWIKGNSYEIKKGGTTVIQIRASIDGIYSNASTVVIKGASSLIMPSYFIIILGVAALAAFVYCLLPLVKKYFIDR